MRRTRAFWFAVLAVVVVATGMAGGAVPPMISYQGRLTDAGGTAIDGTFNLTFAICSDSLCYSPLWGETHANVVVAQGLFTVLLGSITPIPPSVFTGSDRWLGVSLGGITFLQRHKFASAAFAFRSLNCDTAYYALNGAGEIDCSDCDSRFVNVTGPDSVTSTSGTAFAGKVFRNIAADIYGIRGYAANTGIGGAFGGLFIAADSGTGFHFGVRGEAWGNSSGLVEGVDGFAGNTGSGDAYGGRFSTLSSGTGVHYALFAEGYGGSSSPVYGAKVTAANGSSGNIFGGHFWALSGGTGTHYGLYSDSRGSSSSYSYGIYTTASNSSSGRVYGGSFNAVTGGTNFHIGVEAKSEAANTLTSYGVWGEATNTSSGETVGGYFRAMSPGTGDHYAIAGNAWSASAAHAYGSAGWAQNTSTGGAYGGLFVAASGGSGIHYGLYSESEGGSSNHTYGAYGVATNTSTGDAYGGYFVGNQDGTGEHYGLVGLGYNNDATRSLGVYGYAQNTSSGNTFGGYFSTDNAGTGTHFGVVGRGYNDDATDCHGVYGYAENTSSGAAFGGYFVAASGGSGAKIGIAADAPLEMGSWAGSFMGDVHVQGDLTVTDSKFASVQIDNGEHRGMSCQESPEVWFEDFGEGRLSDGKAHVELDPLFLQTVTINADHPIKVFVQLEGDCNGVYVEKGTTGFDVNELKGGSSNVSFSYRIVAKRRGYEDQRLPVMTGPAPGEMRARSAAIEAEMKKQDARRDEERRLQEQQQKASARLPVLTGDE